MERLLYTVSLSQFGGELESNIKFVAQQLKINGLVFYHECSLCQLDEYIFSKIAIFMVCLFAHKIQLGCHLERKIWNKTGLVSIKSHKNKIVLSVGWLVVAQGYILWCSVTFILLLRPQKPKSRHQQNVSVLFSSCDIGYSSFFGPVAPIF